MISLTDYIVDTQGVLPPEAVMNNRRCYHNKTGQMIILHGLSSSNFKSLDDRFEKYRFRRINYNFKLEDLFILETKIEKLLYDE